MIRAIKKDGLHLIEPPEKLVEQLKHILTYPNAEHASHERYTKWLANPHPRFVNYWEETESGLKVPRNIIEHEYTSYLFEKYEVVIEDQTILLPTVDWGTPLVPRNAGQSKALEIMMSQIQERHDGLLIAPTGTGKTPIMLEIARRLGQPTLWLTHRVALMEQAAESAIKIFGATPGYAGDGKWDIQPLTFAIVNTLARKEVEDLVKLFGTVIIDEAHLFAAKYYLGPVFQLQPKYMLATTATPNRRDGFFSMINYTVGPILHQVSEEEADIMDPIVNLVKMPQEEFSSTDVDRLRGKLGESKLRNEKITEKLCSLIDADRKTLVFAIDKDHAKLLKKELSTSRPDAVIEVIIYNTKGKERKDILTRAKRGEVDVLLTVKIAREGLDVPAMTTGFHTRPHDDADTLNQEMGRVRRTDPSKTLCEWYDCVDFGNEVLVGLAKKRLSYYKTKGFKIN